MKIQKRSGLQLDPWSKLPHGHAHKGPFFPLRFHKAHFGFLLEIEKWYFGRVTHYDTKKTEPLFYLYRHKDYSILPEPERKATSSPSVSIKIRFLLLHIFLWFFTVLIYILPRQWDNVSIYVVNSRVYIQLCIYFRSE